MAGVKRKTPRHTYMQVYHTEVGFMTNEAAARMKEWVDADPVNAMRARGRDVLDVRSLRFVQHRHPREGQPISNR
jgi:hypothetical protein